MRFAFSPVFLAAPLAFAGFPVVPASADSDNFYTFTYEENQSFENNSRRYDHGDGYVTNFGSELFPLLPDTDGQVFLRGETVTSPAPGHGLEDGRTSVQIDFKF
jgi:hypothetical protein